MAHDATLGQRMHMLFVYGTLKRAFSNNYFLRKAEFVGPARTVERYGLYVDEFPLVYPRDEISPIIGELYRVDSATLSKLDALENHPKLYRRELVEVKRLDNGVASRAWIYFFPERTGRLIASGEFKPSTELPPEQM